MLSLDLETTGLDERIHEAWEVSIVAYGGDAMTWQFPLRKKWTDRSEEALVIGGFHDRYRTERGLCWDGEGTHMRADWVAESIAAITAGETLMGCSIQFDLRFLTDLLRFYNYEPTWHHRALDLGSYVAGCLNYSEPVSSSWMAEHVTPNERPHTAEGDAQWNWLVYDKATLESRAARSIAVV